MSLSANNHATAPCFLSQLSFVERGLLVPADAGNVKASRAWGFPLQCTAPHKHPSSFPLVCLAPKSLEWLLNLSGAWELPPNANRSVRLHRVELKLHPQSPSALFIVPVLGLQGKHK